MEIKKICLLIFISYIKIIYQEILVCAFLSKMFKGQVSVPQWHFIRTIVSVCVCVLFYLEFVAVAAFSH